LQKIPIAITSYLELIVWPNNLTLYHSEMMFSKSEFIIRAGICLLFFIAIGYSYFKNRRVFFGLTFFLISLIPTLTPWGISWIVAERYVYLGSIGIFLVLGVFFSWLIQKNKGLGWTIVILVILSLSIRTIIRNADWKNQDTLWVSMIRTSPSSPQNHNNLGDMYGRQGDMERAVVEFQKAIELNPQYGDAYHNLGNTYQQMEKYDLALESFQKAISFNPNLWQSYANIGVIYYQQKQYPKAESSLLQAIKIFPTNDGLYAGLGVIYLDQNQEEKAMEVFKRALEINPTNQLATMGMAKINELRK
jgi:tetratricopeptide (TPR) repeat protein